MLGATVCQNRNWTPLYRTPQSRLPRPPWRPTTMIPAMRRGTRVVGDAQGGLKHLEIYSLDCMAMWPFALPE